MDEATLRRIIREELKAFADEIGVTPKYDAPSAPAYVPDLRACYSKSPLCDDAKLHGGCQAYGCVNGPVRAAAN